LVERDGRVELPASSPKRPVNDVFSEEEEDFILGNGISVAILLPLAEFLGWD
jgi:hypothetical protein